MGSRELRMPSEDRDLPRVRRARPSPTVAACLAEHAPSSECAVLVGNRAGVVEWANAAWSRITGFPLEATLEKPITHFLGEADIQGELVEFVSQRFIEGRTSTIQFPFETFDGRSIWVHLDVHAVRNELGEISEFVAIASDATERRAQELAASRARPASVRESGGRSELHAHEPFPRKPFRWIAVVDEVCRRVQAGADPRIHFDVSLDTRLPPIPGSRLLLEELVSSLLEAALAGLDGTWGCVTVVSGRTQTARSHFSQAHPVPARPAALARSPWLYLEVHDTGPTLEPDALDAIRNGDDVRAFEGDSEGRARVRRIALARELCRAIGGELCLDSTPGCGTQALILLPLRGGS